MTIDPPYRLDPFQNIVGVHWAPATSDGGWEVVYHTDNWVDPDAIALEWYDIGGFASNDPLLLKIIPWCDLVVDRSGIDAYAILEHFTGDWYERQPPYLRDLVSELSDVEAIGDKTGGWHPDPFKLPTTDNNPDNWWISASGYSASPNQYWSPAKTKGTAWVAFRLDWDVTA